LYICDNSKKMIQIKTHYPLEYLNSFGIRADAAYYVEIDSKEDILNLMGNKIYLENAHLILGGGSNILFTGDYEGMIIHPKIKGIHKIGEDASSVIVKVGSGVIWDDFVKYAVKNNWGGVENLSIIPGNVGASPIQNIGAYGVEVKDVIEEVEGYNLAEQTLGTFSKSDCQFGYRKSIFKQQLKNNFLITHVTFRLSKPPHTLYTSYGAIEEQLIDYPEASISTIREVVTAIRKSKLPDPLKLGNAGSFFKNPVVESRLASELKELNSEMPVYPSEGGNVKLSAAWLIDHAGCKGIKRGHAGTHKQQPLVIVNLGNATGNEIVELANLIQEMVHRKYGIHLEPEVNIIR
jgi:UDP-N-acetylmuramate dehydrogenase